VPQPTVSGASPYTKGGAAMNTHSQCKVFGQLLTDGEVRPIAPRCGPPFSTVFPRLYRDWIAYDRGPPLLYDARLRLTQFPVN
jgi:hypothetical protein